jgi:hypothetical protein
MLFADPGKYEYHTCEQILAAGKAVATRRSEAAGADPRKAEQGAAGGLVARSPIAGNTGRWWRNSR